RDAVQLQGGPVRGQNRCAADPAARRVRLEAEQPMEKRDQQVSGPLERVGAVPPVRGTAIGAASPQYEGGLHSMIQPVRGTKQRGMRAPFALHPRLDGRRDEPMTEIF